MLLQYRDGFQPMELEQWDPEVTTIGLINLDDLNLCYEEFGFHRSTVDECERYLENFCQDLEIYDDYSFGLLSVLESQNIFARTDCIGFYIRRNLFLMVESRDEDGSIRRMFEQAVKNYENKSMTLEKFVYDTFSQLINGHLEMLGTLQEELDDTEELVLEGKAGKNFLKETIIEKKQLLRLRSFYEQLAGVGEDLQENENNLFHEEDLRYFHIFTDRVLRLVENTNQLRESLVQIREVYQSSLDYELNRIMKVFTVVTTIFLPLTLIVGWYGMNFSTMPELNWRYGYIGVIGLSVIVIALCIFFFKKKKLL